MKISLAATPTPSYAHALLPAVGVMPRDGVAFVSEGILQYFIENFSTFIERQL